MSQHCYIDTVNDSLRWLQRCALHHLSFATPPASIADSLALCHAKAT